MPKRRRPPSASGDAPPVRDLPTKDELRRFVAAAPGRVGKREAARAFGVASENKPALKAALKALESEGALQPAGARRFQEAGRLPEAMIVQVTGTDPDGDAIARPVGWKQPGPPPMILMAPEARGRPALAPGERVLARLRPIGRGRYEGRTIKRISDTPGKVLGVFRPGPDGGRIVPTDRRARAEWVVPRGEDGGAQAGEIVLAEPLPHAGLGLKPAQVIERLGKLGDARSVSLIAIHTHGIPHVFPPEAEAAARLAKGVALEKREDMREVGLITIDGEDARDFDDAVYAEPDGAGFRLIVAIADVAHYVRAEGPLDRTARERGNSVYFPDRVVPMLPEALSNGWCSLRPNEDRGCLFVEMFVGVDGKKTRHRFGRGLMRSAARMTYEQVQALHDELPPRGPAPLAQAGEGEEPTSACGRGLGEGEGEAAALPPGLLQTLYAAFRALLSARIGRGTLDLDLPERKVVLDGQGRVAAVAPRPRLDSHRLIEEFMVLANVAAAEELERRRQPCMYRIHPPPTDEKLDALRSFLHGLDISLPAGNQLHPRDLDRVLRQVAGTDAAPLVNETVLRSQSQASYSPENIGHFGLGLSRYAHFTSPIRRYADLLVHRALIRGLRLGADGVSEADAARFEEIGEHITSTERRAALAERDAIDRYLAAYMAEKTGSIFAARISGVTRSALFVTVADNGANGIVPIGTLPDDYWMHDEREQMLTGRRTGMTFRLAQPVDVLLAEANPVTGSLLFHILQGDPARRSGARDDGFSRTGQYNKTGAGKRERQRR